MRVIACNSSYGQGGVGQHFAQLVEMSRADDRLLRYYAPAVRSGDDAGVRLEDRRWHNWLIAYTPVRYSPGWRSFLTNELFDRHMARRLVEVQCSANRRMDRFMGFVGKALRTFRAVKEQDAVHLELVAANSHVDNVRERHRLANEHHGLGDSWLNAAQQRKTAREYQVADTIYVHSEYVRRSFLNAGVPGDRLRRHYLHVHPRFKPPTDRPHDDTFRIVYVGRMEATKGIPLLLDAFERLPVDDRELILVGNWTTRRMRSYMQDRLGDPRIHLAPGDPLPAYHRADVFLHPTYEDGFGYAPVEALACGVPVIVTEDTGMKEYVVEGENGYVVPTGDVDPVIDRLLRLRESRPPATASLLPPVYDRERSEQTARSLTEVPFTG
ncbi:glycosyltransferase family 4 protein [Longibacter sp.]|uniref:glycosyltransferase family 4 protein n=1 Tax=Longibacter sp. TaxID=2045415 RepID=UPI003EBFA64D